MFFVRELKTEFRSCISITAQVEELVAESGIREGICVVALPHTTAGLAITSFWDPRGLDDLMDEIDRNIPTRVNYKHQDSPYDASGHVKSALMGASATLLVHEGRPVLGSSQGLVFVEFDGPRERTFQVQVVAADMTIEKCSLQTAYMGMHEISGNVQRVVEKSGIRDGICHIAMLHSTAGLLVAAKDKAAQQDIMEDMERMVPTRVDFKHRETASDAGGHVKTALTGSQITLPVREGKVVLGKGQAILFAEFDGPRPRSYYTAVLADAGREENGGETDGESNV